MSLKDRTRDLLLDYYNKNGLEQMVRTAQLILKDNPNQTDRNQLAPHMRGELSEVVLECALLDALKDNISPNEYRLEKSLVLKDVDSNNEAFFTELDMVLFTPYKIVAFESKSYQGAKTLTDKGTLKVKGRTFDVYKQHSQHMKVLMANFRPFLRNGVAGGEAYKMYLFNFSLGEVMDNRIASYKTMLPLVGYEDIANVVMSIGSERVWNMKLVNKALDLIVKNSETNHSKHLEYVRGLNNGAR